MIMFVITEGNQSLVVSSETAVAGINEEKGAPPVCHFQKQMQT